MENNYEKLVEFSKDNEKEAVVKYCIDLIRDVQHDNIHLEGKLKVTKAKLKSARTLRTIFAIEVAAYVWIMFFVMAGIHYVFK